APGTPAARGVPTPKDLATLGRGLAAQPADRSGGSGSGQGGASGQSNGSALAANATLRWSSDKGWIERPGTGGPGEPPETAALPMLAQLTSAEQRWADREEDITTVGGDPFEVGQVFARRWAERLTDAVHLQHLSAEYPRIPHRIDGELLRYAARFGLLAHKDDQIDEHDRYAIRAGFWREIDTRTAAERAPAGD
ncbi:NYN domain-containing protein, partial [Streptomyces sp. URMC 127]